MISLVLADEERQVNRLKSLLRSTGDRLEYEIRRADDATTRAEYAETRAKEVCARLGISEASRSRSEMEATKSNDEARLYRLRLESAEHEMGRLRSDIEHLQKRRKEAEELVSKTNDAARGFQVALDDYKAREREREDVAQIELDTWFSQGKEDGWDAGHAEGLEEGRSEGFKHGLKIGKKEGFDEGLKIGRKEERQNALQAFDRFLADEMDDDEDLSVSVISVIKCMAPLTEFELQPQERTRKWAESIYRTNASPSPAPETPLRTRPPELRRRFYTESELSSRTGSPRSSRNYQDRQ